jgi:hypothetical protein
MRGMDFELQHARMTALHSGRDDRRLEKAALLSRCDALLEHRRTLLADMREFAAAARGQFQETVPVPPECEAGAAP